MEKKLFQGKKSDKMTTILPPPKRNDYKLDRDYKKAYKEWKKVFNLAIKKY